MSSDRARAWAWVAHLRRGGATPWMDWTSTDAADDGRLLPGAQQLELVRRLNAAGRPSAELVERVLVASAPGRGRQDLELLGAVEPLTFGPRPIDPATLRADDLVRVAVGLIAEDVVAAGETAAEQVRVRRWRTRYRIAGDPWLAGGMRQELIAQGRPPGGRGARVAVVGTDLATMVVHAWVARCFRDGGDDWAGFCAAMRSRDRVPPRVDLPAVAARWSDRLEGLDRLRVVLEPERVAEVVGVRRIGAVPEMAADAAELARRTAGALGLLVVPARRDALLRTVLRPRLVEVSGPPPVVAETHREWLDEQAAGMQRRLRRGGYPVVGDPDALLPRWPDLPARIEQPPQVLNLALDLLLRPAPADGRGGAR